MTYPSIDPQKSHNTTEVRKYMAKFVKKRCCLDRSGELVPRSGVTITTCEALLKQMRNVLTSRNMEVHAAGGDYVMDVPECDPFQMLPWEDVIFKYIFNRLQIQNLCHLRAVNTTCLQCVQEYLKVKKTINLTWVPLRFNEKAFQWLTNSNKSIQCLILRNSKGWLTDSLLLPVLESNMRIRHVDFTNCTAVTNSSVHTMAVKNPYLEVLVLHECVWLSVEGLLTVAMNCPELQKVNLTGCWEINDEAVITLILSCQKLEYLSISKIYGLTDRCVHEIARNCPELQHLNLRGCWRVTDDSIRMLGEYCKKLRTLEVSECRDVTEISLARLRVKGIRVDRPMHKYSMNPTFVKYLQDLKLQSM